VCEPLCGVEASLEGHHVRLALLPPSLLLLISVDGNSTPSFLRSRASFGECHGLQSGLRASPAIPPKSGVQFFHLGVALNFRYLKFRVHELLKMSRSSSCAHLSHRCPPPTARVASEIPAYLNTFHTHLIDLVQTGCKGLHEVVHPTSRQS
jgi:hypothetical protein